jgi:hypothetical protein
MRHRGLRYHITSLMMRTEMVSETSVSFIHLMWLIAREDFTGAVQVSFLKSYGYVLSFIFIQVS